MLAFGRVSSTIVVLSLLAVSCGHVVGNGPVVAVRPPIAQGAALPDNQAAFDAIEARMAAELDQASSVETTDGSSGTVPLDANLSLSQVERIQALQQIGDSQVGTEVGKLQAMVSTVNADTTMNGSQKARVNALVYESINGLTSLKSKIDNDSSLDIARTDVAAIADAHVEGFVLPVAHMLVAAYQLIQLAGDYQGTEQNLKQQIGSEQAAGIDVSAAVNDVADLDLQVSTMLRSASIATQTLPSLSAAAYPANKDTLDSVHVGLLAARVSATQAGNDIIDARQVLNASREAHA